MDSVRLYGLFKKFSCARHTYHFTNYQVGDFSVCSGNFCAHDHDVHTMLYQQYLGSLRLAPITVGIYLISYIIITESEVELRRTINN